MLQTRDTILLEPDEVGMIAHALQVEARGLLALGGDSAIRGLAVRAMQRAIEALLQAEKPPVCVLQRASARQVEAYLRQRANG